MRGPDEGLPVYQAQAGGVVGSPKSVVRLELDDVIDVRCEHRPPFACFDETFDFVDCFGKCKRIDPHAAEPNALANPVLTQSRGIAGRVTRRRLRLACGYVTRRRLRLACGCVTRRLLRLACGCVTL